MVVYAKDVIHLAKYVQEDMLKLNQVYSLKEGFGPPDTYLRANVKKVQLYYGITVWYMNSGEYMHGAMKNVDLIIEGNNESLKSIGGGHRPYPSS